MQYRLSRAAVEDLRSIYLQGLARFGREQANRYHSLLGKTFEFLADNPRAARIRGEMVPPVRIHPLQSHIVVYQITAEGSILIIRVRHAHEDWTDPLFQV